MRKNVSKQLKTTGKVGAVYTTRSGKKKVGITESCQGVTAWRQVTTTRREKVYYGMIPPHQ